jgi:hypothetical protein
MDKKNAFRQHYNIIIFTRNPDEENPEGRRTTSSVVRYVLAVWKQFSFILPSYYRSLLPVRTFTQGSLMTIHVTLFSRPRHSPSWTELSKFEFENTCGKLLHSPQKY